ncbi:tyrosine-type recombinase/integrase [Tritonibacter mobilis]|uniref:tyrosine-type recombinase/integrase n=1 Tax=Tritonibacter mobilis TaxID=379347 RepID=UPI000806D585|nr:tyrosine-type recombinase/integrase [Tritonibacter mobilis]
MKRRNPYPGARIVTDARGGKRIRLRKTIKGRKIDTYLPGRWGSATMEEAYNRAITDNPVPPKSANLRGTFDHVITDYLSSKGFLALRDSTRNGKRQRLDWVRKLIGSARLAELEPRHVENLMDRKGGPSAANRLHKELSQIYSYAKRHHDFTGSSPTGQVDRRKIKTSGFHTWTVEELEKFREAHPSGTLARLALELILGTGAARQDVAKMGRHNIRGASIWYSRGKTGQDVTLPLEYLPELQAELRQVPNDQLIFILNRKGTPYTTESFGNWFADCCMEAGLKVPRAHGLRKYGASRLAERGATEWQIMAFLAHTDPRQARLYVQAASRKKLAADALSHLTPNVQQDQLLDKTTRQPTKRQ